MRHSSSRERYLNRLHSMSSKVSILTAMIRDKFVVVGAGLLIVVLAGCAHASAGSSSVNDPSAVVAPSSTSSIGPVSACGSLLVEAKVGNADPVGLASCAGTISPAGITEVHAKVGEKIQLTTQGQPITSLTVDNSSIADASDGYVIVKAVGNTKVQSGDSSLYCNSGSAPLPATQCVLFDLTVGS